MPRRSCANRSRSLPRSASTPTPISSSRAWNVDPAGRPSRMARALTGHAKDRSTRRVGRRAGRLVARIGDREAVMRGLRTRLFEDISHRSMTVSWPVFVLAAAVVFLLLNGVFALAYYLGDDPVANVPPGSFAHDLYFSIETIATVGYGDMHPQTHYGHVVAS